MSEKEPESKELDKARAETLLWAIDPTTEIEKHSSAHLNPTQPFAFSIFREIMNARARWATCTFDKDKGENFNPKKHYTITDTAECQSGKKIIDNLLAGTAAVKGRRAELVLETTKDIGRPQQNVFGQLAGMLGKSQELEQPEEVPSYE